MSPSRSRPGSSKTSSDPRPDRQRRWRRTSETAGRTPAAPPTAAPSGLNRTPATASQQLPGGIEGRPLREYTGGEADGSSLPVDRGGLHSCARSATSTPCPSADFIIASCTTTATRPHGGPASASIRCPSPLNCGAGRAIPELPRNVMWATTLAHASGEWLSSEWPLCPLAETSAPRSETSDPDRSSWRL